MRRFGIVALLGLAVLATGCTRSLPLNYTPGVDGKAAPTAGIKVGIAEFEDKRTWVEAGDAQTQSFISFAGPWKFGVDYQGQEYVAVNKIVQDVFAREFGSKGFSAKKVSVKAKQDAAAVVKQESLDYLLQGKLLSFEFANDAGMVTVTSRRIVTLSVDLLNKEGKSVLDQTFSETNQENEGMGVLHTTNVDKLVNGVFKKVVANVITRVSEKLALAPSQIRIAVHAGKQDMIFAMSQDGQIQRIS